MPTTSFALHEAPASMLVSQAAFYHVTISNTTEQTWASEEPNPVHLSYHWYDEHGQVAHYDGYRNRLPRSVAPGESLNMAMRVHPPSLPGRYILELDLVREGMRWLEIGQRLAVEVRPVERLRAVLVTRNCIANDAVGNNLLRKLRLLREQGLAALVLAENIDAGLPLDDQCAMVQIDEQQLVEPEPRMQWAANHFWNADLYIFDYPDYYPLLELIRLITRGTVIFDYHSVTPPQLWQSQHNLVNLERGVAEVRLVAFADYAIAHSEYTRSELLATGLIAPERVFVLSYAVPDSFFQLAAPRARPAELQPGDGPVLLYVGRMAGNKRIDVLIRAAARIKLAYPKLKLLLVGDDSALPYQDVVARCRSIVDELGLHDTVVFTGPRRHEDLPGYYSACDIYITSSEHEGFCIPVVEAMAYGKPVVASAATALPWTVGDAGLLFEPGDAEACAAQVLALLDSRAHRQQ